MSQHAYSRSAIRELNRLDEQAKKDICTIVPILNRTMVEEACTDASNISDGARVLRETGIEEIGKNIYSIHADEKFSLVCTFEKQTCAILAINRREADCDIFTHSSRVEENAS